MLLSLGHTQKYQTWVKPQIIHWHGFIQLEFLDQIFPISVVIKKMVYLQPK